MGTLFTGKSLRSAVFLNFTNENVKNILEKKLKLTERIRRTLTLSVLLYKQIS